jgi:hypothetical protein
MDDIVNEVTLKEEKKDSFRLSVKSLLLAHTCPATYMDIHGHTWTYMDIHVMLTSSIAAADHTANYSSVYAH